MTTPILEPSNKGAKKNPTLYERFERGDVTSLSSMVGRWREYPPTYAITKDSKKGLPWIGILSALIVTILAYWINQLPFHPFTLKGAFKNSRTELF